jgi:hypothetical protein
MADKKDPNPINSQLSKSVKSSDLMRRLRNQDLIKRMQDGEPLQQFNSELSWFPPRPIIEKDQKALDKLYYDKSEPLERRQRASPGSKMRAPQLISNQEETLSSPSDTSLAGESESPPETAQDEAS